MKWAVLVVRILVGLQFVVSGVNYFAPFMKTPEAETEHAKQFLGALAGSKMMVVVKVLEIAGGLLLLSGRFAPVGLVLLTPVVVNILLYELLMANGPGIGAALTALIAFLIYGYRRAFAPVFAPQPLVG